MQNVLRLSSVTYEWSHVTPASALLSTTDMQARAPSASEGIPSPSGNVRSTMYRGIASSFRLPGVTLGPAPYRPHRPRSLSWRGELPILRRDLRRLVAAADAELAEDGRHVVADRLLGDDEPCGDLRVRQAFGHEAEYFELALGQARRMLTRLGAGAAGDADAAPAQLARADLPEDEQRPDAVQDGVLVSERLAHVRGRFVPATPFERRVGPPGEEVVAVVVEVALCRVCEALLEPVVGRSPVPMAARGEDESRVERGDLLIRAVLPGERQRHLEAARPAAGLYVAGADRRQRADLDLALSELLGERERLPCPGNGRLVLELELVAVGKRRVRPGQLRARRELLENFHGLQCEVIRFFEPRGVVRGDGRPAEEISFLQPVSELAVALQRFPGRGESVLAAQRDRALVRAALEERGDLLGGKPVREAEGPRVLLRRLAVGAELGGPHPRRACMLECCGRVAGCLRVMGEAGVISLGTHRPQRGGLQLPAASRVGRLLDGASRELVPEANTTFRLLQDARREAVVEPGRPRPEHLLEQLHARLHADHGRRVEHVAGGLAQPSRPREDGVADARRHAVSTGGEGLRDEERVAAGLAVELCRGA